MRRSYSLFFLAFAALALAGCATKPTSEHMEPDFLAVTAPTQPFLVNVNVDGGRDTDWPFEVSAKDYQDALLSTINHKRIFQRAFSGASADLDLHVSIVELEYDNFGINLEARIRSRWTLVRQASHQVLSDKIYENSYTAGVDEGLVAHTRLKNAIWGAARASIREGLEHLAEVDIRKNR